jgi:hypothetical protein
MSCPQCLVRKRSNGTTEQDHAMLAAMIVAPGHSMELPLMPEFIAPQDGAGDTIEEWRANVPDFPAGPQRSDP